MHKEVREGRASRGWSSRAELSRNHFILQSCSHLSGNDTVFFFSAGFLASQYFVQNSFAVPGQ